MERGQVRAETDTGGKWSWWNDGTLYRWEKMLWSWLGTGLGTVLASVGGRNMP